MQTLYFTIAAILLYLVSDWLLQRIESYYGRQFEQRNLIFFFILATLSLTSFALIRSLNLS